MFDQHFLSSAAPADVFGPLQGGERIMWRGRCGVAEYAFDEAASMPRWTLPEGTDVLITDRRVRYSFTAEDGRQVKSGELRWLWPQHLRVQPGARSQERGAAATQIQLVCGGADGTYPALVFAGGDLATVGDADRVANIMRQAIARFRVDNAEKLGLTPNQGRMLSRLLIGPEFRNHQGGDGQTVSMLGAMLVSRPAPAPALPAAPAPIEPPAPVHPQAPIEPPAPIHPQAPIEPPAPIHPQAPVTESTRLINYRPGRAADAARALLAARAEQEAQRIEPDIASRASDLAARVANLVTSSVPEPTAVPEPEPIAPAPRHAHPGHAEPRLVEDVERFEVPTTNLAARAESVRRTAARMAANSARSRAGTRRADREAGSTTRGKGNR